MIIIAAGLKATLVTHVLAEIMGFVLQVYIHIACVYVFRV